MKPVEQLVIEVLGLTKLAIQQDDPETNAATVLLWIEEPGADAELRIACARLTTQNRTGTMTAQSYLAACKKVEAFVKETLNPKPPPPPPVKPKPVEREKSSAQRGMLRKGKSRGTRTRS